MAAVWIAPDKSTALLVGCPVVGRAAWRLAGWPGWAANGARVSPCSAGWAGRDRVLAAALAFYALGVSLLDSRGDGAAVNANVLAAGLLVLLAIGVPGGLWARTRLVATRRWEAWAVAGGWGVLWLAGVWCGSPSLARAGRGLRRWPRCWSP